MIQLEDAPRLARENAELRQRVGELEAALIRAEATIHNVGRRLRKEAEALADAHLEANRVSDPRK